MAPCGGNGWVIWLRRVSLRWAEGGIKSGKSPRNSSGARTATHKRSSGGWTKL